MDFDAGYYRLDYKQAAGRSQRQLWSVLLRWAEAPDANALQVLL